MRVLQILNMLTAPANLKVAHYSKVVLVDKVCELVLDRLNSIAICKTYEYFQTDFPDKAMSPITNYLQTAFGARES